MLDLFRRYQRVLYIIVTVVIVISFLFFGTYSTLSNSPFREQIAFKAVDGTSITRHELDEMAAFIGTDAADKLMFGGAWGPNFFNDGVITKDFLESGLGLMLANAYPEDIRPDLQARLEKEKRYSLYAHPQAKFIGTESAWNYFSPQMAANYRALKEASDPASPEAFQTRAALFLMEKQFPQHILHQVLRHQEKQYNWLTPDRNLDRMDLSLFGYHTLEDWFGPRYVRLVSEFIINAAKIAEQKGYEVTKADALASLIRNADISFKQNAGGPHLEVASAQEYFNEQLRRLGMDQNGAAAVWRQVMLFRLLFQDMGNSVFVDPYTFNEFNAYALESVSGEIYRLPKELRLADFKALQKFETYLDAVAKRSDADKAKLTVPTAFLSIDQVAQKTPELVQKRYTLEVAQINKKALEGNVVVKESWNWEVSDKGWDQLKKQFPELGVKPATTREQRFAALDDLDNKTRGRVDAYARTAIVDEHPEWLDKALAEAHPAQITLGLHENGKISFFTGLKNGKALMELLDAAPLAGYAAEDIKPKNKEAADKLARYTNDGTIYYNIKVIDRAKKPEILTFAEADREGVLADLLDKNLEAAYPKIREADPKLFQKNDQSWKSFADVKELVAEKFFANTLEAIKSNYAAAIAPETPPEHMIPDYAATLRLYPYAKGVREKIQRDPAQIAILTVQQPESKPTLTDQWKLERAPYQTTRSSSDLAIDSSQLFNTPPGAWTKVNTPANGDLNFFHLAAKSSNVTEKAIADSVGQARTLLSDDAQQRLMRQVLSEIQEKGAISFEYLKKVAEIDEYNREELHDFG
jgi:GcvH upstream region-like protein